MNAPWLSVRPRSGRRPPGVLAVVAALTMLAAGAAGCANVPGGGRVVSGKPAERAEQVNDPYVRLIPVPPRPEWGPDQVVSGFLAASASFDDDHRVARSYLARPTSWKPGLRPTVTVFQEREQPQIVRQSAGQATVRLTGDQLGTIGTDGQYVAEPKRLSVNFEVAKNAQGLWRVTGLPRDAVTGLLLTKRDVERAFRTVNLYFYGPDRKTLVPNGIFLPLVNRQDLPGQLVRALLGGPSSWLREAVQSEFPQGTGLRGLTIDKEVATVDLTKQASGGNLERMSAQLSWTLRQLSEIRYWRLEIEGKTVAPDGSGPTQPVDGSWEENAPDGPPDEQNAQTAYVMGLAGNLSRLSGNQAQPVVTNDAGRLVRPAVAPDAQEVAGLSRDGGQVLAGELVDRTAKLRPLLTRRSDDTGFTAPVFDRSGKLWTVETAKDKSWLWVRQRGRPAARVEHWGLSGREVLAFRVARDGVRAAVIVKVDGRSQVQLGRITRSPDGGLDVGSFLPVSSELLDAKDLSWRDFGTLAVLGRKDSDDAVLPYLVPVGGGAISPLGVGALGDPRTIAAAPGAPVLIGTKAAGVDRVCLLRTDPVPFAEWTCAIPASDPNYPR